MQLPENLVLSAWDRNVIVNAKGMCEYYFNNSVLSDGRLFETDDEAEIPEEEKCTLYQDGLMSWR